MRILVRVTDTNGVLYSTIEGATNDEPRCPDDCSDHDGHFSIDHVREGRTLAHADLADQILRYVNQKGGDN